MDLKEQLVIWKKTGFLLDNIALSPKLCGKLVEEEIITTRMMNDIQGREYNVERNLHLLTILGTHGENIYEKFLRALEYSDHGKVSKELQKTAKYTKFGEMMPPCFTYFLDMSEFLRKYPHIAVKLGEAEKYLLQCFIEGKIEIHSRKKNESISNLETDKAALLARIADLERQVKSHKENEKNLERQLKEAQDTIETLKGKLKEMTDKNNESWNEIRRLKHYRLQQHELEEFLKREAEEAAALATAKEKGLTKEQAVERLGTRTSMKREGSKPTLKKEPTKSSMQRDGSRVSMKREGSRLRREGSKLGEKGVGAHRKSLSLSRSNTKSDIAATVRQHNLLRIQILTGQQNLLADKQFHLQLQIPQLALEEHRLQRFVHKEGLEKPILKDFKSALTDVRKQKRSLQQMLLSGDKETRVVDKALHDLRSKVLGVASTPCNTGEEGITLVSKLNALLDRFKRTQAQEMLDQENKHDKDISNMVQHAQELNNKHQNEEARLRGRIRLKMVEIHKREQLHKRLRNQIHVLTRYHAKNMNATVSVEQCRKIVRGIIGDARKLAYIADERDQQEDEQPTEQELKYMTKQQREQILIEQMEKEKREKKKEAKRNKIKRRRRKRQGLTDDRLMYIGDRMALEWRALGQHLGLTNNYMDIIEMETKGQEDNVAFNMLKTWRDEENGKVDQLFDSLQKMGKTELSMMVVPKGRIEIVEGAEEAEDGGQTGDADTEGEEVMDAGKMRKMEKKSSMMAAVPQLPPIAAC